MTVINNAGQLRAKMNSPIEQNDIGVPLHGGLYACICAETWQFDSKFWADNDLSIPPFPDTWFIGRQCWSVLQRYCTAVQFSLICTLFNLLLLFYLFACFTLWQVTYILLLPAEFLEQDLEPCAEIKCFGAAVLLFKHYHGHQRWGMFKGWFT